MAATPRKTAHDGSHRASGDYRRLLAMIAMSFAIMYLLMYAMVDRPGNVFHSLNQVHMAGLMAAPMLLIEVWLMRSMYPDRRLNLLLGASALVVALLCWLGIRGQWAIGDRRSAIPALHDSPPCGRRPDVPAGGIGRAGSAPPVRRHHPGPGGRDHADEIPAGMRSSAGRLVPAPCQAFAGTLRRNRYSTAPITNATAAASRLPILALASRPSDRISAASGISGPPGNFNAPG